MNEKKIIEWRAIQSPTLEDGTMGLGIHGGMEYMGINSQANKLIAEGFVPYGEMIISFTPRYQPMGMAHHEGGGIVFTKEFVKYEP